MNVRFVCLVSREKPIFDILVEINNKLFENSKLKLKKRKKIERIIKK